MTDRSPDARVHESFARQGLMRALGATLAIVAPGVCEIRWLASELMTQQHGFAHAGILTAAADSAGGYAAMTMVSDAEEVVTAELKMNCLEPARGRAFMARGRTSGPAGG